HGAAAAAAHAPDLDLQVDARVAAGEVADAAGLAIVEGPVGLATGATNRFFRRRSKRTTRALGSPKKPRTVAWGQNPGNRYASMSRRGVGIHSACQVSSSGGMPKTLEKRPFVPHQAAFSTHTLWRRAVFSFGRVAGPKRK